MKEQIFLTVLLVSCISIAFAQTAMKNFKRLSVMGLLIFYLVFGNSIFGGFSIVSAQDDWKQEYADVCKKTENAMILSPEELKTYIDRCNKLLEHINALEGEQAESEKKVFTKKVQMCRDLYDFALKHKEEKE